MDSKIDGDSLTGTPDGEGLTGTPDGDSLTGTPDDGGLKGKKEGKKARKRVIIVDDNISYLSMVRNLLKSFYEVYPAPSADKLFKILEKFIPDLVMLDVNMPEMSGFEAIAIMKESPRYKDIPVVFLTAKDDDASAMKGLELGAADYVTKPFYGPLLLRRISNILLIEQQRRELQASSAIILQLREQQEEQDL